MRAGSSTAKGRVASISSRPSRGALEAALRERLSALEVGQLDLVKAFAQESPPTKLSFYSPASGAANLNTDTRNGLVVLHDFENG